VAGRSVPGQPIDLGKQDLIVPGLHRSRSAAVSRISTSWASGANPYLQRRLANLPDNVILAGVEEARGGQDRPCRRACSCSAKAISPKDVLERIERVAR
jgi:hypothetical protein